VTIRFRIYQIKLEEIHVTSTYRDLINWLMVSFTYLNLQKNKFQH